MVTRDEVLAALGQVMDPEIHRPITDLDMVKDVSIDASGLVAVEVLLTVAGCPLKDRITRDVTAAVAPLPGVSGVKVDLGVMTEEQRQAMVTRLRGPGAAEQKKISFWGDEATTRVLAVASGKGGVGKSSVTVNLAAAMAAQGHRVAVIDCDIYGFSVPRMLGATGRPVGFNGMIMPLEAHGVRVISIGFFIEPGKPVMWRGPMLHRAIQQFLTDVYWGELDYVLADLPPGTGDVSISLAQMLPGAEMLLVTTPQEAAERVAVLAGKFAQQNQMKVAGVIENMSYFICPSCEERHHIFGSGGGEALAKELGSELLGQVPIDVRLREGADAGKPLVVSDPDAPASQALLEVAAALPPRRSLAGRRLPLIT
ncbi:MAG TPA: Mrp/NBP35 family ATP-binding protein [Actinomycetes bacterium]|jgi:ATP-binding protein involved in chromosome partitioning|nr:Mrp/NBP35 family ATP-binding protein [Actinomycetes bacterium]